MIAAVLLLAAAAGATPSADDPFAACLAQVERDPAAAIETANAWRSNGGGIAARQCEAMALAAQSKWASAALAFTAAARAAEVAHDPRVSQLWVQAGNAALANGNAAEARAAFGAALVNPQLIGAERGEAHLDRARALVMLGETAAARVDLDRAVALVPQDPLGWLLSASLARRTGALDRAATDITRAAALSPDDPSIAFEAGNIAILSGADAAARTAWEAAVKLGPTSVAGKAAAESLDRLGAAPTP